MKKKQEGFTLIELLIALAIASILPIVAIVVYTQQVRDGRRIDGVNSLLSISLAEERYRSNNSTYGTLAEVWNGVTTSAQGYYTLSITNTSATAYTITATAVGDQANDAQDGTSCATLTITMSNGAITESPSVCWPS